MKKLFAIVMVVAMMLSMSVIASADQSATISYDAATKTAVITISTTAFNTYDVAVISEADCAKITKSAAFITDVVANGELTFAGVENKSVTDVNGVKYAVITGAGCDAATGADIAFEGEMYSFTYNDVEAGTEFKVVTNSAASNDITAATALATLTAEVAAEETPVPTEVVETPAPTEPADNDDVKATDVPTDPTKAPADPTKAPATTAPTTTPSNGGSKNAPKTADFAPVATMITLVVVAGVAVVALKKKATN